MGEENNTVEKTNEEPNGEPNDQELNQDIESTLKKEGIAGLINEAVDNVCIVDWLAGRIAKRLFGDDIALLETKKPNTMNESLLLLISYLHSVRQLLSTIEDAIGGET